MAIIRVNKTKNYTVMSNIHLKEKGMSLKAKGLLSVMLSVPDKWNFSIAGLSAICKENESAIKSALNELKQFGYLVVTKKCPNETKSGRIEYNYDIYEQPQEKQGVEKQGVEKQGVEKQGVEKQGVEKQGVEILPVENQGQLNTNKLNTNKLNTNKKTHGEFMNVCLSDEEFEKIKEKGLESLIDELSEYIEGSGKKYKSHYATILQWARKRKQQTQSKGNERHTHKDGNAKYDIAKCEKILYNEV